MVAGQEVVKRSFQNLFSNPEITKHMKEKEHGKHSG